MTMMFEVEDLIVASPATVSRIFLKPTLNFLRDNCVECDESSNN